MATALLKLTDVQLGSSVTATNNFTFYQPSTPDGTVRLGNGNSGSVTDIMTLNSSGNVGIGTSSPSYKLDIVQSGGSNVGVSASDGTRRVLLTASRGSTGEAAVGTTNNYGFAFETNSTQRMYLDSSGNLGLGVTPSAWNSSFRALQFGSNGSLWSYGASGNNINLASNVYYDSGANATYLTSGYATRFQQINGAYQWFTAPSGTAGNAITFTQAMTLDASGNLGIGTSSPAYRLDVSGISRFTNLASSFAELSVLTRYSSGFSTVGLGQGSDGTGYLINNNNSAMVFGTNATERMRIDSSGNVGIGTTSPTTGLDVSYVPDANWGTINAFDPTSTAAGVGGVLALSGYKTGTSAKAIFAKIVGAKENATSANEAGYLAFLTNSGSAYVERMRIDSSGNLLVGTTSGTSRINADNSGTAWTATLRNTDSSGNHYAGVLANFANYAPNSNTSYFFQGSDSAAARFQVFANGGIANYQANNSNLSDRNEKTDFAPAKSYLDVICSIPVQTFKYIDQTDDEPTLGVVAQDVQAVAPELVMESDWGIEGEPKVRLSIYQTDLQYALMKCIQEQQAIIESLTKRIETLEGA